MSACSTLRSGMATGSRWYSPLIGQYSWYSLLIGQGPGLRDALQVGHSQRGGAREVRRNEGNNLVTTCHGSCHFRETGAGPRGDRSRYIETDVGTVQSKYRSELAITGYGFGNCKSNWNWTKINFECVNIDSPITPFQVYGLWSLGESWSECSKESKAAQASASPSQGRAYLVQLHSEPELQGQHQGAGWPGHHWHLHLHGVQARLFIKPEMRVTICFQRWVGVRRGLRSDGGQGWAPWDVWQGGHVWHVQQSHAGEDAASGWADWCDMCMWLWVIQQIHHITGQVYVIHNSYLYRDTKGQVQMLRLHKADRWSSINFKDKLNVFYKCLPQRAG